MEAAPETVVRERSIRISIIRNHAARAEKYEYSYSFSHKLWEVISAKSN